jgi:hypothetical protein
MLPCRRAGRNRATLPARLRSSQRRSRKCPAMTGLPLADAETHAFFLRWLETFSSHVQEVDYASARPMFYPQILAVGTHQGVLPDREAWIATQWDNVWPRTSDLHFSLNAVHISISL